jgi:hypothetical protein
MRKAMWMAAFVAAIEGYTGTVRAVEAREPRDQWHSREGRGGDRLLAQVDRGPDRADTSALGASPARVADPVHEFRLGLEAMEQGDLTRAATHFQHVVREDPQSFEAHNNLAVIYAEQGKNAEALDELRMVLRLRPDYYRGRKNLAELYARLASEAFVEAAAVAPADERPALLERAQAVAGNPPRGEGGEAQETRPPAAAARQTVAPLPPTPPPALVSAPTATAGRVAADVVSPPGDLLSVGADGAHGVMVTKDSLRVYQQHGDAVRFVEQIPVRLGARVPPQALYVATPDAATIKLVPIGEGGRTLTLAATGSPSASGIAVDPAALERLRALVQPHLTPVLVRQDPTTEGQDPAAAAATRQAVVDAVHAWSMAWSGKDLSRYLQSYLPDYVPEGAKSNAAWRQQRARVFDRSGSVSVTHATPVIVRIDDAVVTLSPQEYRSDLQLSTGVKQLTWRSTPTGWRISKEVMDDERVTSPR